MELKGNEEKKAKSLQHCLQFFRERKPDTGRDRIVRGVKEQTNRGTTPWSSKEKVREKKKKRVGGGRSEPKVRGGGMKRRTTG